MSRVSRQLGELLVDRRLLSRDALEQLLLQEKQAGTPFAKLVMDEQYVGEKDVLRLVAERVGLGFVDFEATEPSPEAMGRLDGGLARRLGAVPVSVNESRVTVAVSDPFQQELQETLTQATGSAVTLAIALRSEIEAILAGVMTSSSNKAGSREDALDDDTHINDLLLQLSALGGSDLHLTAGIPPKGRINGELVALEGHQRLMPAQLRRIIYEILTGDQRQRLEDARELDCSHPVPGKGRFRVNVFFQRDSIGAVLRVIPSEIKGLADLGLPPIIANFATLHRGLVLVTGPTGSGKSTTLASIIDLINASRAVHIMTVEDPIEFLHRHKRAVVNQREVGSDTRGFMTALKHVLRQDPDVILVGELRDLETISAALTAAETGHLVFGTLHTQSAPQSIDRMIDVFPSHQQDQIRIQLSGSLQGVVSQQLLPTADKKGRVLASEVMVAIPAIRNLIREGKVHQIPSILQTGGKHGMQTMDQNMADLVKARKVSREVAMERASDPENFKRLVGG